MFTVRLEPSPQTLTAPGHIMYQAEKYMVYHEADGHKLRITLQHKNAEGTDVFSNVKLEDGDVAYVMNDHGVTVDVLRTKASKTREKLK